MTFVAFTVSESSADPPQELLMSLERCIIVDRFEMQGEVCHGFFLGGGGWERLRKSPFYTEEKRYFELYKSEIVDAFTWLAA